MFTSLKPSPRLVAEAMKLGKHKTKTAAIRAALKEYACAKKNDRMNEAVGKAKYLRESESGKLRKRPAVTK
jgi:hypothetical protein